MVHYGQWSRAYDYCYYGRGTIRRWLRQLTCVIDDLNLKYGISHRDVGAQNLLVNPETDALALFDFNFSARIGSKSHLADCDDIKGVIFTLYEIITRDTSFNKMLESQRDPAKIEGLEEWVQHPDVKLDRPCCGRVRHMQRRRPCPLK